MFRERAEHITGGQSRHEKRVRHFAEEQNYRIGEIDDTLYEFSFQVLEDTLEAGDKKMQEVFLEQLCLLDDLITKENASVTHDPAHGWYIKVDLVR